MKLLDLHAITPERASEIWDQINGGVIDDFHRDRPEDFARLLVAGNTVAFEHPHAIILLTAIQPRLGCEIHFWTWDGVTEAEMVDVGREILAYAFETYQLERITATPPAFNKVAQNVATKLGFRFEGNVRHAFLYNGKYFDVYLYGLLKSEFAAKGQVHECLL